MGDRTPIIVAAIGLIGTVTVGLLTNADKLQRLWSPAPPPAPTPQAAPPPLSADLAPSPPPAAQDGTGAAGSAVKSLTGLWASDDGYRFRFHQSANVFSYAASERGKDRGTGDGTLRGRTLTYGFTSPNGDGVCSATLSADGDQVDGRCHMADTPAQSWPMTIRRIG